MEFGAKRHMVFYRKYRPQTIEELDSKDVRDKLISILSRPSSFHALLFTGPKGLGKTSAARIIAKAVNCERKLKVARPERGRRENGKLKIKKENSQLSTLNSQLRDLEPCNKCHQCVSITNGTNIDILEIDGASNRGIDEIRDLREKIKLSPAQALKKVYIIDEGHMLTTEAFNALLKTLEEPPSHVIFILCTTEPHKVPQTIASRCFHIAFKKATSDELVRSFLRISKKEKISIDKEALLKISEFSDGSFRDGVKILEEVVSETGNKKITKEMVEKIYRVTNIDSQIEAMIKFISGKNVKEAVSLIRKLTDGGVDIKYFIETLMRKLHELLLIKVGVLQEKSDVDLGMEDIKMLMDLLTKAHLKLKYSVLPQLPLEIAIIEYASNPEGAAPLPHIENDARNPNSDQDSKKGAEVAHKNFRVHNAGNSSSKSNASGAKVTSENFASSPRQDILVQLIDKVKSQNHSIAGVLRGCSLKSYDGKKLVIEAKFKFHKEKLEDGKSRGIIEDALKEIVRSKTSVSVVLKS